MLIGAEKAMMAGVVPFLPAEALKIAQKAARDARYAARKARK